MLTPAILTLLQLLPVAHANPTTLPTVQVKDFVPGRSWTWDYIDKTGHIYSTEKYEVLSVKGSTVLLEMSSAYDGTQNLQPHERIEVPVDTCLKAYRNPVQRQGWSFTMFYLENGKWVSYDPSNTLAFEEKFNCNPHVFSGRQDPYLTVFKTIDSTPVFQQKLWQRLESSWFDLSGDEAGIAREKLFASDPNSPFVMKRRQTSNE